VTARPDVRLFGFAAGAWAATIAALQVSVRPALTGIGVTLAAAGAVAWVARRPHTSRRGESRGRAAGWALAAVLLGAACGGLWTAARTASRDSAALASLVREHAQAQVLLAIVDDPRPVSAAHVGPTTYVIPARLRRLAVRSEVLRLDVRVVVFGSDPAWRALLPSQVVDASVRLSAPDGGDLTAALLNAVGPPSEREPAWWAQRAAARLRTGLQRACAHLPPEPGGLLPGLVIGDTSRLDPALAERFRATGLTHLVAVSGANVAIVLGVVLLGARWCRAGPWLAALICAIVLAGFVILVRPSPSVVRAAATGVVGLVALGSGRASAAGPALATAVVAGLMIDPGLAVDAGFTLSVFATGALVLLAPRWRDALAARGVPARLAEALAVPAAAQAACAPVIAAISGSVSFTAIPANLLAVPAVAPATLGGVAAAVVCPLWPMGAEMLAWLASWPARWLVAIADVGSRIPAGTVPWPSGPGGALSLAAATVVVLIAARRPRLRRLLMVAGLAVLVGSAPVRLIAPAWPPSGAVIVACDVGQGDALVLSTGPSEAVMVDTGPDPALVDGCLRRLGVRSVPLIVVTHFHADHIGGLGGVEHGRTVGAIAVGTFDEPVPGERAVRDGARGSPVLEVEPGWSYTRGWLDLRVVGPVRTLTGTRSDPNNNSLVLRAVSRGVSILLAGDAETEEQHDLVTSVAQATLGADVLKVAHHGSAYQDEQLLTEAHPSVALVSVGADNPYGHPNLSVLARLARDGAKVMRTDRDGDVAVVATGHGLAVVAAGHHLARQAFVRNMDEVSWGVGDAAGVVRVWRRDRRQWTAPRCRRRGVVGRARGRERHRGSSSQRSGRGRDRVRRRRHDRVGSAGRGESRALRGLASRRRPGQPGCQEGSRHGSALLCAATGAGHRAGAYPRWWRQGKGDRRRPTRGGRRGDERGEDNPPS
jgi:competence protein ComEC